MDEKLSSLKLKNISSTFPTHINNRARNNFQSNIIRTLVRKDLQYMYPFWQSEEIPTGGTKPNDFCKQLDQYKK